MSDFFGEGIVAADNEKWLKQRRAAIHIFTTRALRDVMDTVVKEKTLQLRDVLTRCSKEGCTVDMKSLFGKFSSDAFTKIAFGVDLNCLRRTIISMQRWRPCRKVLEHECLLRHVCGSSSGVTSKKRLLLQALWRNLARVTIRAPLALQSFWQQTCTTCKCHHVRRSLGL
jgi:cytochrome P450